MATQNFRIKNGLSVGNNVFTFDTSSNNPTLVLANAATITVGGTAGTNGQVLTSNGSGVYWAAATGGGGTGNIDLNAQYVWTNTHTFSANLVVNTTITISGTTINSTSINSSSYYVISSAPGQDVAINAGNGHLSYFRQSGAIELNGPIIGSSYGSNYVDVSNLGSLKLAGELYGVNIRTSPDRATFYDWSFGNDGKLTLPGNGTINSTSYSGNANTSTTATYLGNTATTGANVAAWITGNSATAYTNAASYADTKAAAAYTNATTFASNASNISSGTVAPARLGSGTTDATTILYGNSVWATAPIGVNTSAQYVWSNTHTFNANVTIDNGTGILTVGNSTVNVVTNSSYVTTNGVFLRPQTTSASNTSEGSLFYDITNHALNIYNDTATPQEIGQQTLLRVINKTGTNIAKGKVVYVSGTFGNRPTVDLAGANSSTINAKVLTSIVGLTNDIVNNNAEGFIVVDGIIQSTNTLPFTAGEAVYISPVTNGELTSTKPTYPDYAIAVGQALNSTNSGKIEISTSLVPAYIVGQPNNAILFSDGVRPIYNAAFTYTAGTLAVGNNGTNVSINTTSISIGTTVINSTSFSGTANAATTATYLGNTSGTLANVASWITGNSATAYTNATSYASNASNISSGTIGAARLPYQLNQNLTTSNNVTFANVALTGGSVTTIPVYSTDLVNKAYADSIATGVNYHPAVRLGTTVELTPVTYDNGTSGANATLTKTSSYSVLTVDSISPVVTDRILVKDQSNTALNGVYTVTNTGSVSYAWVLTRADDYDYIGSGYNEIDQGDFIYVTEGSTLTGTAWIQSSKPTVIGTSNITFVQFASKAVYPLSAGPGVYYSVGGAYDGSAASTLAVNTTYVATLAANVATYLGNSATTAANVASWITGNSATAYSNATAYADTKAAAAYANAVANAAALYQTTAGLAANVLVLASNSATYLGNSATTGANVASWITGNAATAYANAVTSASLTYQTTAGLAANVLVLASNSATYLGNSSTTAPNIVSWITGNSATAYANAVANAAALYQTTAGLAANVLTLSANAATYLGNSATTGANVASWITGNSATAYSNSTTFASNASNISSGTVAAARLGSGTANSTTLLYGNNVWVAGPTGAIVGTTDTQTLSNKRITSRVGTNGATTSGNITPTGDTSDQYTILGLTGAITLLAPSGTPVDGQKLILRIKDNGTARGITWTTTSGAYRAVGVALPTTTVISKNMYLGCIYNSTDTFWDVIALSQEA